MLTKGEPVLATRIADLYLALAVVLVLAAGRVEMSNDVSTGLVAQSSSHPAVDHGAPGMLSPAR